MNPSKPVCQSCGSPIFKANEQGTERNGEHSDSFCRRCFAWGSFTEPGLTAEGMRENVRKRMADRKLPRFLTVLLADQVYGLKRWETPAPAVLEVQRP